MPSDTAAIIIACVSAGISLAVAVLAEWARRRLASWQHKRTKELNDLRFEQDQKLAHQRDAQARELENLRDTLIRRREERAKADDAEKLVARYRDPLLQSAYDLQYRIYNVFRLGFRSYGDPKTYFRDSTLFVLAEFLAWLEILRQEMLFLDLGAEYATRELGLKLQNVQDQLASTPPLDDFYVFHGHQRAIGELMMTRLDGDVTERRRHGCIGYAAFIEAQNRPEFAKWFERLGYAVERLPEERPKPQRLVKVQHALNDLIDLLDREYVRFPAVQRQRL